MPRVPFDRSGLSAAEVVARLETGVSTPWIDPLPDHLVGRSGDDGCSRHDGERGLPLSYGTVTEAVAGRRWLYTFCWRDPDADRVLLWVNRLTDETCPEETLMERVPGTDLWVACFVMPADWRASYCLLPAPAGVPSPWGTQDHAVLRAVLDHGRRDPVNPLRSTNGAGVVQSVVQGPDAPGTPWPAPTTWCMAALQQRVVQGREVWLHEPPGATGHTELPLLVVLDGEAWTQHQDLPAWLETGYAAGVVTPHRTLFVASGGLDRRWRDLGRDGDGLDELCEVLVPWARQSCATPPGPTAVTVAGQSLGGLAALQAVVERPDVVGNAASQSAALWQAMPDVAGRLGSGRVHLTHGAQEWVLADAHRELATALRARGIELRSGSHQGGHDYAWWRVALLDALAWLHPVPAGVC